MGLIESILDPNRPAVLVLVEHYGCGQSSEMEVELARHLMVRCGVAADRMALISPHRAQNNATARRLSALLGIDGPTFPVIDTVEHLQGAGRDVVLFALSSSDLDRMLGPFLNNPNRFNVAITRARRKLVVVGSRAFFLAVPQTEAALEANRCFKEYHRFCRENGALFCQSVKL